CSLPLNVAAARTTAAVLADHPGRVVLRHHDLPWQRRHLRALEREFPPRLAGALHTTINLRSRRELIARDYGPVVTIQNRFDLDAPLGDRDATRRRLGFPDDELVLFQPTRAIERKNVPGAIRYAASLARAVPDRAVRYWLTGPAEDGYQETLDRLVERSPVPVTIAPAPAVADGYAAADVVLLPSTWEGFGNPTIESVWARRPLVVNSYPVLSEITTCGVRFFDLDDVAALVRFLATPDPTLFDVNLRRARSSFSIADLPAAIDAAFVAMGWTSW
ncbi:MAG TPA: glycosyltransferase, partial [Acidimicrobiia bacterium]|nr:glycosyltransferase [Acidimicrobiia bacterium]